MKQKNEGSHIQIQELINDYENFIEGKKKGTTSPKTLEEFLRDTQSLNEEEKNKAISTVLNDLSLFKALGIHVFSYRSLIKAFPEYEEEIDYTYSISYDPRGAIIQAIKDKKPQVLDKIINNLKPRSISFLDKEGTLVHNSISTVYTKSPCENINILLSIILELKSELNKALMGSELFEMNELYKNMLPKINEELSEKDKLSEEDRKMNLTLIKKLSELENTLRDKKPSSLQKITSNFINKEGLFKKAIEKSEPNFNTLVAFKQLLAILKEKSEFQEINDALNLYDVGYHHNKKPY